MSSSFEKTFADNLRRLRKARGYSQEELAHLAGLDKNHPGNIERLEYSPTLATIVKLATALETDPLLLFQAKS